MKTLSLCFSVLFLFTSVQAQQVNQSTKDGFISISLGAAFPGGDFADNDPGNSKAGFAQGGFSFNFVNFGYLFSKNIGITAMLQGAAFPLEDPNFGNEAVWGYGTFLVGPLFTIRQPDSNAEFDLRVMLGSMSGLLDPDTGADTIEGTGGALSLGAGLRYNLSDLIALTTHLDIIGGEVEFDTSVGNFKQPMASTNWTIGIAFRLN